MRLDHVDDPSVHVRYLAAAQSSDHRGASHSLDQRDDAMVGAHSHDNVHLPVADFGPRVGCCWAFGDVSLPRETTAFFDGCVAFPISDRLTEMLPESSALLLIAFYVGVDRLMTHLQYVEKSKPSADLFGAELLPQEQFDQIPFGRAELSVAS